MIYVLEDDESIRELLVYTLQNAGLEAEGFARPSNFWAAMERGLPDLILLDIMLPEEDGLSILRKLRTAASTRALPVMMLTAKSTEYDAVIALDSGADDYVQKPFRMMELLSRVRALLRRSDRAGEERIYRFDGLLVDPGRHLAEVDGSALLLTFKEFELLCLLLENRDLVLTRDRILDAVWGADSSRESRTVDVHVRTLRQKLGPLGARIETVRGLGYKFDGKRQ